MPGQQTEAQRKAAFAAAKLTPEEMSAIEAGGNLKDLMKNYSTSVGAGVVSAPQPVTYNVDNAQSPAALYQMPQSNTMPDWRNILSTMPTVEKISGEQSPEQMAAAKETKTLQDRILGTLSGLGDKVEMVQRETGQPDLQAEYDDILGQIQGLQFEAQAIPLQVDEENRALGRGRTEGMVANISQDLVRKNAIKALGLAARGSVVQGKLGQAKQRIDQLIQVQQMELDYLSKALQFNKDDMQSADEKQANRITARLKERQETLDKFATDQGQMMQMLLKAQIAGAPTSVLAKAQTMDVLGAAGVLAQYIKDPTKPIEVSAGASLIDPITGKVIVTAPKPNSDSPSDFNFTDTQLGKGAANARLDIADFAKLDMMAKNYFINSFGSFQTAVLDKVTTGDMTKEDAANIVRTSQSTPESVKPLLLALLGVGTANADTGEGTSWWQNAASAIGGAAKSTLGWLFR